MTCIVGLETELGVIIGGDSAGVSGYNLTIRADLKVFKVDQYVMGFTGSFRMGQILRYRASLPKASVFDPEFDADRFMATTFVDNIRQAFKDGGYAKVSESVESGGTFLVGLQDRLYAIDSDFQIGRSVDGYDAIGCGANLALGCLYATRMSSASERFRVTMALEAAAHFSAGVVEPFHLVDNEQPA